MTTLRDISSAPEPGQEPPAGHERTALPDCARAEGAALERCPIGPQGAGM